MEAHLQVHSLSKSYPGRARALDSVSLNVYPGEVHAIIGENGAGKSTLAKVIAGLEPYREGEMHLAGEPYRPASPGAAIRSGVVMVHQHFQLFETLTAAQNVVLGSEPGTRLRFGARTANEEVAALAGRYGFQVNPESRVRGLSVAQRQGVEILRALYRQASLLLLDEPTSALGPTETKALLAAIRRLRHYGHTIVLIAHKISEVLAVADRITVLRQGKHVGTVLRRDASHELLFEMVTGERQVPSTGAMFSREVGGGNGPAALKLSDLYLPLDRAAALGPISLTVNSAEILGVFTPPHSGQQTLELALVGQIPVRAGQILIGSHDVTKLSPYERRRLGAAFVPSERMARGVATRATVYENAVALLYRKSDRNRLPSGPRGRHPLDEFTHSLLKKFNISAPGSQSRVANLSGGNTQRLLLGRELLSAELMQEGETPLVVVVASPTQGVDARGVGFIHDLLREYRDRGSGVLLLTGDVEELLALSDRITVLKGGGRLSRVISNFPKLAEGDIEALIDGPPPANHVESEPHP